MLLSDHIPTTSLKTSLCARPYRFPGLCGIPTGFQRQLSFALTKAEAACAGVIVEVSLPSALEVLGIP